MNNQIIDDLLRLGVENGASDILIKSDKPGFLRLNDRLKHVGMEPIDIELLEAFMEKMYPSY